MGRGEEERKRNEWLKARGGPRGQRRPVAWRAGRGRPRFEWDLRSGRGRVLTSLAAVFGRLLRTAFF